MKMQSCREKNSRGEVYLQSRGEKPQELEVWTSIFKGFPFASRINTPLLSAFAPPDLLFDNNNNYYYFHSFNKENKSKIFLEVFEKF